MASWIATDQGEHGGVAEMHALISLETRIVAGHALGVQASKRLDVLRRLRCL